MNVLRRVRPSAKALSYVIGDNLFKSRKEYWIPQSKRYFMGETYEGTGKTTGHIINKRGVTSICINGICERGFILTNGWNIIGPTIFFPDFILSWKIKDLHMINDKSLTLFTVLRPKLELLLVGYGCKEDMTTPKMRELLSVLPNLDIPFELMSTENAASTFNFCSVERRYVAAALIPPSKVTFHHGLSLSSSSQALTKVDEKTRHKFQL